MNFVKKILSTFVFAALSLILFTACQQSPPPNSPVTTSLNSSSTLSISPSSATVAPGTQYAFSASGGTAPYTFSVASGGGTVTSNGIFIAPASAGNSEILVTDSAGLTAYAYVTISSSGTTTTGQSVNNCNAISASAQGSVQLSCDTGEQFSLVGGLCSDNSTPSESQTGSGYLTTCSASTATAAQTTSCCESRVQGQPYTRTIQATGADNVDLFCGPNETASYLQGSCTAATAEGSSSAVKSNDGRSGFSVNCPSGTATLSLTCSGVGQ